jgi:glycosyltransferase involved in cell wall biosynthesis
MHTGLPIVCTNNGGQVDFLKQRDNAILFDVGDAERCADAIVELYKDEKLYKKMSVNNKKRIKDFYAEHVASQYIDIFKELKSR